MNAANPEAKFPDGVNPLDFLDKPLDKITLPEPFNRYTDAGSILSDLQSHTNMTTRKSKEKAKVTETQAPTSTEISPAHEGEEDKKDKTGGRTGEGWLKWF